MDRTPLLAGLTLILALGGCSSKPRPVSVGSKNFTEQVVLGEIIAQHLERQLHQPVERRLNLGGTLLAHQSIVKGEIDLFPEYTGTALTAVLKQPAETSPEVVLQHVREEYLRRFGIEWLAPLGIDNTFAMVIRGADARAQHLETLSDAAKAAKPWALGIGYEFEQRPDGLPALESAYPLKWQGSPKTMDLGLLYQALGQDQIGMAAGNATDGLLSKLDLKVLADDRHAFPPYQVCIEAREDRLRDVPGLRAALDQLSGKFNNRTMQNLNYQVDGLHQPVAKVATDFLNASGL